MPSGRAVGPDADGGEAAGERSGVEQRVDAEHGVAGGDRDERAPPAGRLSEPPGNRQGDRDQEDLEPRGGVAVDGEREKDAGDPEPARRRAAARRGTRAQPTATPPGDGLEADPALDDQPGGEAGQREGAERDQPRAGHPPRGGGEEPDHREPEERRRETLDRDRQRQKADQRGDRIDIDRVLVFAKRLKEEGKVDAVLVDAEVGDRPGVVPDRRLVDIEPGGDPERPTRLRTTTRAPRTAIAPTQSRRCEPAGSPAQPSRTAAATKSANSRRAQSRSRYSSSGWHWSPTTNRRPGCSTASTSPSCARAVTTRSLAQVAQRLVMHAVDIDELRTGDGVESRFRRTRRCCA